MLIEQDDNFHIDMDEISNMFCDKILFDITNKSLTGKFIILAVFKNFETKYLTNIFDYKIEASLWISEIFTLQEFAQSLKKFKV